MVVGSLMSLAFRANDADGEFDDGDDQRVGLKTLLWAPQLEAMIMLFVIEQ